MPVSVADFAGSELSPDQAEDLFKQGLDLLETITRDLWDGEVIVRRNAALAARMATPQPIPTDSSRLLSVATKDLDATVRGRCLVALGRLITPLEDALPALLRGLRDRDETVRQAAREGLDALLLRAKEELIPHLVRALLDPSPEIHDAASELLATQSGIARPLVEALVHADRGGRAAIVELLVRLGAEAALELVRAISIPEIRTLAARILVRHFELTGEITAELDGLARSEDESIRSAVASILDRIGIETMLRRFSDADRGALPQIPVEGWTERLLEPAELDQASASPTDSVDFVRSLRDGRSAARANAAGVVGRRARKDELLAVPLAALARDPHRDVRRAAVQALADLGGEGSVEALLAASSDTSVEIAGIARAGLARMGPEAAHGILELARAIDADAALEALHHLGGSIIGTLGQALETHRTAVAREIAAEALERLGDPAASAHLIKALRDPADSVKVAAARALGALGDDGEAVLAALSEARREGAPAVRRAATAATARLRTEPTAPPEPVIPLYGELNEDEARDLVKRGELDFTVATSRVLWDGNATMRRNAALIASITDPRPVESDLARLLSVATRDTDELVRARCLLALGRLHTSIEEALFPLLRGLADRSEIVRRFARDGLDALVLRSKGGLVPHLVRALLDPHPEVRVAASELLGTQTGAARPLVEALARADRGSRKLIVDALRRLGDDGALELVRALRENDLRGPASRVLLQLPDVGPAARTELGGMTSDEDAYLRQVAADILERLGMETLRRRFDDTGDLPVIDVDGWTERALEPSELDKVAGSSVDSADLVRCLRDGRTPARANAAAVLGRRARKDDTLAVRLAVLVRDPAPEVRRVAVETLAELGSEDAVDALLSAVSRGEPSLIALARRGLQATSPAALLGALRPGNGDVVVETLHAQGKAAVPALIKALAEHPSAAAREVVAEALERLGDAAAGAVPALIKALRDAGDGVRAAAARALGTIAEPDEGVLAALSEARRESGPAVRRAASQATYRLKPETSPAPPPLIPLRDELGADEIRDLVKKDELSFGLATSRILWDGQVSMRRNAARVASQTERRTIDADAARLLAVATKDTDELVRAHCLLALGRLDGPLDEALPAILRGLTDRVEMVQAAARDGLDALVARAKGALVPHLVRALLDPHPLVRATVSDLLAAQPESAAALVDALAYTDRAVKDAVVGIIVRLRGQVAAELVRGLREPPTRMASARLLLQLPDIDNDAKKTLGELAVSDDAALAQVARDVLERMGSEQALRRFADAGDLPVIDVEGWTEEPLGAKALDAAARGGIDTKIFLRGLRDGRMPARLNAVGVLARRARGDDAVVFSLGALVRDAAPEVRAAVVAALADVGGEMAAEPLLTALSDGNEAARAGLAKMEPGWILGAQRPATFAAAVDVLVAQGKDAVGGLAAALTSHLSPAARITAAAALERLGPDAAGAAGALLGALRDPSDEVRALAARTLGNLGDARDEVLDALAVARREGAPVVRRAAGQAMVVLTHEPEPPPLPELGELTADDARALLKKRELDLDLALTRLLADGDVVQRRNATQVALASDGRNVSSELTRLLVVATRDSDAVVREQSSLALGRLDTPIEHALPALRKVLQDTVPKVRAAAREGLKALADRRKR